MRFLTNDLFVSLNSGDTPCKEKMLTNAQMELEMRKTGWFHQLQRSAQTQASYFGLNVPHLMFSSKVLLTAAEPSIPCLNKYQDFLGATQLISDTEISPSNNSDMKTGRAKTRS